MNYGVREKNGLRGNCIFFFLPPFIRTHDPFHSFLRILKRTIITRISVRTTFQCWLQAIRAWNLTCCFTKYQIKVTTKAFFRFIYFHIFVFFFHIYGIHAFFLFIFILFIFIFIFIYIHVYNNQYDNDNNNNNNIQ